IFQLIGIQRKTGVLTLSRDGEEVTVSFLDGLVVYAETSSRRLEERIGSLLVRSGKITPAQLQNALRLQEARLQRLGTVLVATKMITARDLHEVLQVQMTQIVHNLFRWDDGRYYFTQEETVEHDRETFTPLSAETILMEGARMMDEWPLIEKRIRSFAVVFRRTAEGSARLADARPPAGPGAGPAVSRERGGEPDGAGGVAVLEAPPLRAASGPGALEATLLGLVDGRASVQQIIDQTRLGDFEVCRGLYDLLQGQLIEEIHERTPEPVAAPEARFAPLAGRLAAVALVALSLAALPWNPLLPWRSRAIVTPDAVGLAASGSRLSEIHLALKVFSLERQALPQSLEALAAEGILPASDLKDPWGRPYLYRIDSAGYEVRGSGA